MNIGAQLLRAWRGERSQKDAARALTLDQGRYSELERGVRRPGLHLASRLRRLTDIDAHLWLDEEPEK